MQRTKAKKATKKKGGNNIKFIVEKIDIDGDGTMDGVLIKRYTIVGDNHKHFLDQKFVPNERIEEEFAKYRQEHPEFQSEQSEQSEHFNTNPRSNGGIKIADERAIAKFEDGAQIPMTQRVIMQDDTSFVQYVKQGAGIGAGLAIVEIIQGFFTSE